MKHAVIYTRVSTQEQAADNHYSLSAQLRLCRQTAQADGYQVVAHFEDGGRSARSMKRPGLQDLLVYCERHPSVTAVFVQDTDRLARNTQDHLAIRAILTRHKVKLISVSQPLLEDSAEGRMVDTIIASVNQFQSDLTARKVLKGMEEKVRKGGWPGKAPIGYRNVVIDLKHQVEPDPVSAEAVRDSFRLYASGQYTLADVSRRLAEAGVKTRSGRALHTHRVQQILRNPFYIGRINWGSLRTAGSHNPLVSRTLFDAVGRQLVHRGHATVRAHRHRFLLRGLLVCGVCGGPVIGEIHPNKGNKGYYRCHKGCGPCLPMPKTEERLLEMVRSLHLSRTFLDDVRRDLEAEFKRASADAASRKTAVLNRKQGLEARQHTLDQKLLSGTVTDDEYRRLQDQILSELEASEVELARIPSSNSRAIDLFDRVTEIVLNLPRLYVEAPEEGKRLYLTLFWKNFKAEAGEISPGSPTELLAGLLESKQAMLDSRIPPEARANLPPPANSGGVIHGNSKSSRDGAPNRHTSNYLFRQLTEHFEPFSAQIDLLQLHGQASSTRRIPSSQ